MAEFNLAGHIEKKGQALAADNNWNRSTILAVAIAALTDANYAGTAAELTAMLDREYAEAAGLV